LLVRTGLSFRGSDIDVCASGIEVESTGEKPEEDQDPTVDDVTAGLERMSVGQQQRAATFEEMSDSAAAFSPQPTGLAAVSTVDSAPEVQELYRALRQYYLDTKVVQRDRAALAVVLAECVRPSQHAVMDLMSKVDELLTRSARGKLLVLFLRCGVMADAG
jgi:hypothetical protein